MIDAKLQKLREIEEDIQKYMTSCNIYNTKIDEIIAFFSDKNKYNNSSHNEIQKVLDWHDILIRRFKNSKTYLEQSFNNRMKDLDNEDSTRYILPKMREYILQNDFNTYPYFGNYLDSITESDDDSVISADISFHHMPELEEVGDIKDIYET